MSLIDSIIDTSTKLFKNQGIKDVKMDDISSALGISKRTLYETIQSRDELIKLCCKNYAMQLKIKFESVLNKEYCSTFERMLTLNELYIRHIHDTHKSFLEEVKKNAHCDPKEKEHKELQLEYFERLLKEGQESRDGKTPEIDPSLKPEIISRLLASQLKAVVQDPMFDYTKMSYFDVFSTSWRIFMRGIATEHGQKVIEEWIANNHKIAL